MEQVRADQVREGQWVTVGGLTTSPVKVLEHWVTEGGQVILAVQVMVPGRESSIDLTVAADWPCGVWTEG